MADKVKVVKLKNAKLANEYVMSMLRKNIKVIKPKVVGEVEDKKDK